MTMELETSLQNGMESTASSFNQYSVSGWKWLWNLKCHYKMAWNQWCTCRTNIQLVDENDSFKWNLHQTIHLFVESMYETLMQFDVPIDRWWLLPANRREYSWAWWYTYLLFGWYSVCGRSRFCIGSRTHRHMYTLSLTEAVTSSGTNVSISSLILCRVSWEIHARDFVSNPTPHG